VPHTWLFKQVDAACHHGGAGTTGASLRAGIPTIIKPFFGDQNFFGARVEDLGVGVCMRKLNTGILAKALWIATHDERMIARAKAIGEEIRAEDGVGEAIKSIYRDLEYAKTLIKRRSKAKSVELDEDFEETWTFVGEDSEPDTPREGLRDSDLLKESMEEIIDESPESGSDEMEQEELVKGISASKGKGRA